jgi:histidyl-tRNA synthetase
LLAIGVDENHHESVLSLVDRRTRTDKSDFAAEAHDVGMDVAAFDRHAAQAAQRVNDWIADAECDGAISRADESAAHAQILALVESLSAMGILKWCEFDLSIVRGLAYYTGTVFEIHESTGAERAIAGGGRYDNLIESFGGPKLPACGFGMGDVVLANILRDRGLLKPSEEYLPRPDAFVIAADDDAAVKLPAIVAQLRKQNLHVRQSYKTTRNVGKLLGDASKCRSRFAVIVGKKLAENIVELKDMDGGEQREVSLDALAAALQRQP